MLFLVLLVIVDYSRPAMNEVGVLWSVKGYWKFPLFACL